MSNNTTINILGIIPARGGSKRIPGKNKKEFAGKPLVCHIIESALKSNLLTDIVLSSDDDDILNIGSRYPNLIVHQRPASISEDKSPAIDYVKHSLSVLAEQGKQYQIVVILQPSSPLTLPEDIDGTIKLLLDSNAQSAVSVMKLDHATHPVKMKTLQGDKLIPFLEEENGRMAEHELPVIYVRNCSVYVSTIETIQQGKIIGDDCRGYVMPTERSVDINDPIDFKFAEFLKIRQA